MTVPNRPAWIENAAQAVTELYNREQSAAGHLKEFIDADVSQTKADIRDTQISLHKSQEKDRVTREKIAEIIHQRFAESK